MVKKFLLKCFLIFFVISVFIVPNVFFDTFNVFHWQNIRFTTAEPNKNFVKTQYIVHNPQKFNAFIFGSSRVGNIPKDLLPKDLNGKSLRWYNMTYSEGIPKEHFLSLQTFLKNGVDVKMVILAFDNISMYASISDHKSQLLRLPFQVYEENKFRFYKPYLTDRPHVTIIKDILLYQKFKHNDDFENFYSYGTGNTDFSLTENPNMERYVSMHPNGVYTEKDSYKDLEDIAELCKMHKIKLILISNPIYETTYKDAVDAGYFDLLRKVAQKCGFYNFSSLNFYTKNPQYYFESSHYRPALGLIIEKMLFSTEEEKSKIREAANDNYWGVKVNSQNIDEIISYLQSQF